jgi:hypothetical protein
MRIRVIQTITVAIKPVQRQGRMAGKPLSKVAFEENGTRPLPISASGIEHPEGTDRR